MVKSAWIAAALFLIAAGSSQAGLVYDGGAGTTVYGATQYSCPGQLQAANIGNNPCTPPGAQYINNNLTGRNDILSSPGSGWQVANPVLSNNVAETPQGAIQLPGGTVPGGSSNATPYEFFAEGGNSGDGSPFGAGYTNLSGPNVGFALTDTTLGCCSASYMITSWTSDYTADAGGLDASDTLNAFLGIDGVNQTSSDGAVASLIVTYSLDNGTSWTPLTPMLLAIGGTCANDVLAGDASAENNAACSNGGNGGAYSAAAVDDLTGLTLAQGATIDFESTLTIYADPASFDSIYSDIDSNLLPGLGLPSLSDPVVGDDSSPTPEPTTMLLIGTGLAVVGLFRKRLG